ncbi:TPA: hypothetical protein QB630_000042 [Pasteurella multocida]|nr:hypothetical protein [Pasteurella multocida]
MKNEKKTQAGKLGGIKGGRARAQILTKQQRIDIARKAASIRWSKQKEKNMKLEWKKVLSQSDAQETVPVGSKMPFLRFTKENNSFDHTTWFKTDFFSNLHWIENPKDPNGEIAEILIEVILLGKNLGQRRMYVDHKPYRGRNHSAPTTHLNYDNATRLTLESLNLSGHTVIVTNDNGHYSFEII